MALRQDLPFELRCLAAVSVVVVEPHWLLVLIMTMTLRCLAFLGEQASVFQVSLVSEFALVVAENVYEHPHVLVLRCCFVALEELVLVLPAFVELDLALVVVVAEQKRNSFLVEEDEEEAAEHQVMVVQMVVVA